MRGNGRILIMWVGFFIILFKKYFREKRWISNLIKNLVLIFRL